MADTAPEHKGGGDMIWAVMIGTGLLTFAMRFAMFSGLAPKKLPPAFEQALGFVPIAVLTAIILPAVLIGDNGSVAISNNAHLPAAILAATVALITRSVLVTIISGLGALWLLVYLGF
jgi:branched-subunit amino acid transport protein